MMHDSSFDHQPDLELGAALREALTAQDDTAFAAGVVRAAEHVWALHRAGADWWEVLYRWTRPGVAAAVVALVAGVVLWLGILRGGDGQTPALGDPLRGANGRLGVPSLLATSEEPHVDEVLAVALGN